MRRPLIASILFIALSSSAGLAASPDVRDAWSSRLRDHQSRFVELDRQAQKTTDSFMDSYQDRATIHDAEAGGVYATTRTAALLNGRRRMLAEWMAYLKTRPSARTSLAWLKEHAAWLDDGVKGLALSEDNLKETVAANAALPFNIVIGLNRLIEMEAFTEGAAAELHQISEEARAYYGARAAAADQSEAAAFGDIAETMHKRQAALHDWSLTCRQTELSTRCAG